MRVFVVAALLCVAGGCVDVIDDEPTTVAPPAVATRAPAAGVPAQPHRELIGRSVEGRPIEIEYLGSGEPAVLILGGIHGDEVTSVDCTRGLIALLRSNPGLVAGRTVAIIEVANPDGYARKTRTNANGVDCNRNFPARNFKPGGPMGYRAGVQPSSEPETRAILSAIAQLRPKQIVTIHSIKGQRQQTNYDGPGEPLARAMSAHNGYPVTANIGYPTPGSLGSYAGRDLGIPIITLELPKEQPGPAAWKQNRDALLTAIAW